jgi:DNA-binding response OmpR family regulator
MARILIAEDERDIRDLIAFVLRFAGYEVVTAADGEEACQLALRETPDLILLDVRMPKMTGYQACQWIKAEPALQRIPVVFLSAKSQETEVQAGLAAGAQKYLLKPFAPDQLVNKLSEILRGRPNQPGLGGVLVTGAALA